MRKLKDKMRTANPGWLFCFGLFSTLAVGGVAILATLDLHVVAGWIELAGRTAWAWVSGIIR